MILLVHLLFGAAIGYAVKNIPLAIILAFLSHYFLDFFPHIEYPVENIEKKQWHKILPDALKVFLDFCSGILLIWVFSNPSAGSGQAIIYICALVAILPDGFTVLNYIMPRSGNLASKGFLATLNKILEFHNKIHHQIIHFLRDNPSAGASTELSRTSSGKIKISRFWRIASQVIIVAISIILLRI